MDEPLIEANSNLQPSAFSATKRRLLTLLIIVSILCYVSAYTRIILPTVLPQSSNKTNKTAVPNDPNPCDRIFTGSNQTKDIPVARRPPWLDLMNSSSTTPYITSLEEKPFFYLTTENHGRLGNRLFGYASLFGIAWRNPGRIPLWNNDEHGLHQMFGQLRIAANHDSPYAKDQWTNIDEDTDTRPAKYITATEKLPAGNIHLRAYLQYERYFAHVEDQLRYDFTFSPDLINEARNKLNAAAFLRDEGFARVIVHVRLSDMTNNVDRSLKEQLHQYLNWSMAYFDECLPKAHFIVISDDISWCRQNMKPFGQHTIDFIDGERSPAVDLAIASLCDHAIITFGTFGWWAAWFANGLTLVNSQDTFKVWRPPFNSRAVLISLQPA